MELFADSNEGGGVSWRKRGGVGMLALARRTDKY
jgi:hypothetical protein